MIQMVESKPGEGMTLRTVSFQGTRLTSGERARIAAQKPYAPIDWNALRETIKSRETKRAPVIPEVVSNDWYWDLEDRFRQYGRCEFEAQGTPCVADMFGF